MPGAGPCGRAGRHSRPAARLTCLLAAGEAPAPGRPRLARACRSAFLTTAAPRRHRHLEEESRALLDPPSFDWPVCGRRFSAAWGRSGLALGPWLASRNVLPDKMLSGIHQSQVLLPNPVRRDSLVLHPRPHDLLWPCGRAATVPVAQRGSGLYGSGPGDKTGGATRASSTVRGAALSRRDRTWHPCPLLDPHGGCGSPPPGTQPQPLWTCWFVRQRPVPAAPGPHVCGHSLPPGRVSSSPFRKLSTSTCGGDRARWAVAQPELASARLAWPAAPGRESTAPRRSLGAPLLSRQARCWRSAVSLGASGQEWTRSGRQRGRQLFGTEAVLPWKVAGARRGLNSAEITSRQRGRQRERGGSRLPAEQRARCGTRSQDPEIMT
ncbi:uncharacterized protein LOC132000329 [Mustela nigripes]|uniref:uncharacterized protein LOC132000329 n=1 Tax=Mustela nigripes TaxID=77151 RepID=UPI0028167057|nr:uncharacterized protein LOC132000329 [Mustela nigripes]XP_059230167.1 uncharacterized protein LOC132000329 [Mustela nigripes]XP_059230168.1 uncharacterized protein LOC132000329 [Mustela nigripes]